MNSSQNRVFSSFRTAGLAAASVFITSASSLTAADIYLTRNGDFNIAGPNLSWSDGLAPGPGNNYFSQQFQVFTASEANSNRVFAGDSLTIGNGATSGSLGTLVIRNFFNTTVADLRLNNGVILNSTNNTASPTLLGNITLIGYGLINPTNGRDLRVNALIKGTGELRVKGGKLLFYSGNNTYSGGTLLETDATGSFADVRFDGALGSGNVTMQTGTTMRLNLGVTNNYIADTASLIFATGLGASSVTMSFTGTDIIGGLSFDGGTTWAASGTWGAIGSGAANQHAIFTGTGLFNVVSAIPEPSSTAALAGVMALGCTALRRRRSR